VLSQDQREVVLLRIVADQSVEEVAGMLGKSEGAIKALQHRALAALRRHFDRTEEISLP
jgi:RNA polymerase sigma-70 factor (ECF subfamily)